MKIKTGVLALLLTALYILTGCNSKQKDNLEGVWRLTNLEINGTNLNGASLGDWKWEFNEEGGYLTDVAGAREKGLYKLRGQTLKLKSVTHKERPEQVLTIVSLDSVNMHLQTADTGANTSNLYFIKMKEREYEEKD